VYITTVIETLDMRDRKEIRKATRNLNVELAKMGREYYDRLPIGRVYEAVERHGFDASALDGIWCGHEGRVNQSIGDGKFIQVNWCRVGDRDRFELNAYVS
jgi:hypothetical protein